MPAIDPSSLAGALPTEWTVAPLDQAGAADPEFGLGALEGTSDAQPGGFSSVLGKQLTALSDLQADGATASEALATGTATDPAGVVMAVERARLSMQLASQLRTKGVEAINEVFRTQV
ncbi:MAG TPA: flagellar hook-basal body complex protein FliE [Solirubrobacteraceae bacterium]|nr:flagellar hook-basal body complex protein FliE [Solirubrobacteraceae bacterium]